MTSRTQGRNTRGYINHNPLNIRYSKNCHWHGQQGSDAAGFCVFSAFIYGIRAAVLILKKYMQRGDCTISRIIERWAPPTENSTSRYIRFVSKETTIPPDKVLSIYERGKVCAILRAMIKVECSNLVLPESYITIGYDLAITDPNKETNK